MVIVNGILNIKFRYCVVMMASIKRMISVACGNRPGSKTTQCHHLPSQVIFAILDFTIKKYFILTPINEQN